MSNSTILTFIGKYVDPLDLKLDDIDIRDIAHALSNICRFTGHVSSFYSVAQHSVIVSKILKGTDYELWGLLHDSTEAYLNDVSRPIKEDHYFGQAYRGAEKRAHKVISEKFGLLWPEPPEVKEADIIALATERRDLMPQNGEWEILKGVVPTDTIKAWLPKKAERKFIDRYNELTGESK